MEAGQVYLPPQQLQHPPQHQRLTLGASGGVIMPTGVTDRFSLKLLKLDAGDWSSILDWEQCCAYNDCEVTCGNADERSIFPVNSIVLASWSSLLYNVIKDVDSNFKPTLVLDGVDAETAENLVECIYNGSVKSNAETLPMLHELMSSIGIDVSIFQTTLVDVMDVSTDGEVRKPVKKFNAIHMVGGFNPLDRPDFSWNTWLEDLFHAGVAGSQGYVANGELANNIGGGDHQQIDKMAMLLKKEIANLNSKDTKPFVAGLTNGAAVAAAAVENVAAKFSLSVPTVVRRATRPKRERPDSDEYDVDNNDADAADDDIGGGGDEEDPDFSDEDLYSRRRSITVRIKKKRGRKSLGKHGKKKRKISTAERIRRASTYTSEDRKGSYPCKYCDRIFTTRDLRLMHVNEQHVTCEQCGKSFPERPALDRHLLRHEFNAANAKGSVKCLYCEEVFPSVEVRKNHTRLSHQDRIVQCEDCPKWFIGQFLLNKHIRKHRPELQFKCELCDRRFLRNKELVKHLHLHRQGVDFLNLRCQHCRMSFRTLTGLTRHDCDRPRQKYPCPVCKKEFASSGSMITHSKTHRNEIVCEMCTKSFGSKYALSAHQQSVHSDDRNHVCSECGRSFKTKGSLYLHTKTHTDVKDFSCTYCDFKTNTHTYLKCHIRIHTGERPFECTFCNQKFRTAGILRMHKLTHTKDKKFACSQCDKRFYTNSILTEHLRIHTGEKPYACHLCSMRCRTRDLLNHHMKTHARQEAKLQMLT